MWRIETIRYDGSGYAHLTSDPVVRILADETRFDRHYLLDTYVAMWREVTKIRIWWEQ